MRGSEPREMGRDLEAMAREEHDLLVIGGGIVGCGVARDAAMRGLRVAIVEKEDFSYGTTSRSTRLIHGGLRYLELHDFALVHEGLRERQTLLRIAPHLVHGLPFVTPIYAGDRWSPPLVRAGMILYDFLSWGKSLPHHRMLSPRQVLEMEPGLTGEGLRGGALYYDAEANFPERICIENLQSAQEHGARSANHARARALLRREGRVCGVEVEDRLTGRVHLLRARLVLNAAGPWGDEVARLAVPRASYLRPTKGIHLVVPRFTEHAVVLLARRDGRVFFVVPWGDLALIGTTDTDFSGSLDAVTAGAEDVAYLLQETRRVFPNADLGHVLYTMAGVRPLVRSGDVAEWAVSRAHRVVDHAGEGAPGLLSVFGAKITPYRSTTEEAVDRVMRLLGKRGRSRTAMEPLPGGLQTPEAIRPQLREQAARLGLDEEQADALVALYGTRAVDVLALAEAEPALAARLVPGRPEIRAQVHHAVRAEMARSAADVLLRRTGLGYAPDQGLAALPAVSREVGTLLGWNAEREREEIRAYERHAESTRVRVSAG